MVKQLPHTLLSKALPACRLDTQAVHGLGELVRVSPSELAEFRHVLQLAREHRWRLLVAGHGTRLGSGATPERADLVLSTRAYSGVVAYEPGDGTLTAKAGSSMHELAEVCASGGFDLTPDVAHPEQHTLGGILGAGVSGIERLARGPARHHVLGMQVLLADGSQSKTGGRLVKNVTGYDLQRLYAGSRGSLCLILEASLRLFPQPRQRAALRASLDSRAQALELARGITRASVAPEALLANQRASAWELVVLLAGRGEAVQLELGRLRELAPGAESLEGEAAAALRAQCRDALEPARDRTSLELSALPSQLEALLHGLDGALEACGLRARLLCQPALASVQLCFEAQPSDEQQADLHRLLLPLPGHLHWSHAAPERQRQPFGELGAGAPLMRGFKRALDPAGVFAQGGFDA